MEIDDEFNRVVLEPLLEQEKAIGDDLKDYRICAMCLNYVERDSYNEHMKTHGYEIVNLG